MNILNSNFIILIIFRIIKVIYQLQEIITSLQNIITIVIDCKFLFFFFLLRKDYFFFFFFNYISGTIYDKRNDCNESEDIIRNSRFNAIEYSLLKRIRNTFVICLKILFEMCSSITMTVTDGVNRIGSSGEISTVFHGNENRTLYLRLRH